MSVVIERIPKEAIPKSLLLLADPSEANSYVCTKRINIRS